MALASPHEMMESRVLIGAATEAIMRSLSDGAAKGYRSTWTRKSREFHVHCAALHAIRAEAPDGVSDEEWQHHLQHALCRIAMALARDKYGIKAAQAEVPRPAVYDPTNDPEGAKRADDYRRRESATA